MREIKFEAWHKKYKKMYKVLHLHMETNDIWATVKGRNPIEDKDIHIQIQPKDAIIRQYTGLKDKNGKEIYEGDIATVRKYGTKTVTYEHGMFKLGSMSLCTFTNAGTEYWCEVVGNIYENPIKEARTC